MQIRKNYIGYVLAVVCMLFMLSGLIVSADENVEDVTETNPVERIAYLQQMPALPSNGVIQTTVVQDNQFRYDPAISNTQSGVRVLQRKNSDANGRIIMKTRYTNSVHYIFRPEIAGG